MKNEFEILAAAYLSGELNSQDQTKFEESIENDDELKKELEILSQFWNKMNQKEFNTDSAWNKLSERIDTETTVKRKKLNKKVLISIAAAAILIFGVLAVLLAEFLPGNNQIKYIAEQRMEITLPDASKVILQKGSKLTLDERFGAQNRNTNLKGEAWFEVQPNKDKPFIIEAARCEIKVVGTKFGVNSKPNEADKIVVKSGEVLVSHKYSNKQVSLIKNENVAVTNKAFSANIDLPTNYLSWVDHIFYYSNTTLKTVCKDLNLAYNKKIILEGKDTPDLKLSATFKNQSIDEIAQIIAQTHNLKVSNKNDIIKISK
jgi:transmembrane sensor